MKAIEARKIAEHKADSDFREIFDKVIEEIKRESKSGKFQTTYYGSFPETVETAIKELGYTVERKQADYNGTIDIIIKW